MNINYVFQPHVFLSIGVLILLLLFICNRQIMSYPKGQFDSIMITLGLLYSWILFLHGWRLDSILILAQILLIILSVITMTFNIIPMRFEIENLKNQNQNILTYIYKRNKELYILKCESDTLKKELKQLSCTIKRNSDQKK